MRHQRPGWSPASIDRHALVHDRELSKTHMGIFRLELFEGGAGPHGCPLSADKPVQQEAANRHGNPGTQKQRLCLKVKKHFRKCDTCSLGIARGDFAAAFTAIRGIWRGVRGIR